MDTRQRWRGLAGCLLYGAGGVALVCALRLLVIAHTCEDALSEGRGTVAIEVFDEHGAVVASQDVPVSQDGVRQDRTVALSVAACSVAALAAAFILRGPPWRGARSARAAGP